MTKEEQFKLLEGRIDTYIEILATAMYNKAIEDAAKLATYNDVSAETIRKLKRSGK